MTQYSTKFDWFFAGFGIGIILGVVFRSFFV